MAVERSSADADRSQRDVRCECGRLMARRTSAGIELKCRRCKRVVVVPTPPGDGGWIVVPRE